LPVTSLYLEMTARAVIAFLAILIIARVLEKERAGQLTYYEYLAGITTGVIAGGIVIQTRISPWPLLLALFVFSILNYLVRFITLKSRVVRKVLAGEPVLIIQNGKIMEQHMKNVQYNIDDLLMQLRSQGVFNISDVEFAVLEADGRLSVLLKSSKKPVTAEDLQLESQYQGLSSELIIDGVIIYQNLDQNNLDESWLINELKKQGIQTPGEVHLAILDAQGNLYVDKKDDEVVHNTRIQDDPGG
jgi:uncharacterized membrane protein YcaP (DUF421 family)